MPDDFNAPAKQALVFLSHASRDQDVAAALSELLTTVSLGVVKTFRSSDKAGPTGIPYGVEYFGHIFGRLREATDAICILTNRSVDRPWILYEAGVARGYGHVEVYALTIDTQPGEFTGTPFTHFQNVPCEEGPLTQFVIQLLKKHLPTSTVDSLPLSQLVHEQVKHFVERVSKIQDKPRHRLDLEEILLRVEQLLKASGLQTSYVGQYPQQFDTQVCDLLLRAKKSILIACDYPAYGFVTDNDLYKKYKQILLDCADELLGDGLLISEGEKSKIFSLIVSAKTTQSEIIKYPFPDSHRGFETLIGDPKYAKGRAALEKKLREAYNDPTFSIKSLDEFYSGIAKVNELEYNEFPFPCYEVADRMPIFAWIVDHSRAAFAIPTYLEGQASIEHAFSTIDASLVGALEFIIEEYRKKATKKEIARAVKNPDPARPPREAPASQARSE
jgi:hypothetical protein